MRVEQVRWTEGRSWEPRPDGLAGSAELVLAFGGRGALERPGLLAELAAFYPRARLVGCSTAGEILGTEVSDGALVATAVRFEHTRVAGAQVAADGDGLQAGRRLAAALDPAGLAHVFVLASGLTVNGSELVRGLTAGLPAGVGVTGGLAGDGVDFQRTLVVWDGELCVDTVAAVGFYGARLQVGYGSLGGWDPFGPQRLITRSRANVLYELDGQPALELYKRYLGPHAADLPAAGLRFPLSLTAQAGGRPVVRTLLGVDERHGSMTFAGDVPEDGLVRLMKASFERLIDGAADAARASQEGLGAGAPELALLISCVGRKMLLEQRVEEELEAVRGRLGERAALAGFYSYGEICPLAPRARCELNNQTMTITTLAER